MSKKFPVMDEPEEKTEADRIRESGKKITEDEVCRIVMNKLGKPDDFMSCVAHKINMTWYRVNVRCKKKVQSNNLLTLSEIRHSYFVQCVCGELVDGDKVDSLYPLAS
jgi:hypothetical protein